MADYTRYQRFQRRQDNVNQVITAQDTNAVQSTLESVQREVFGVKDSDFLQKCLFTLDHNPLVNAMWIDLMESPDRVDQVATQGLAFFPEERGWAFPAEGTGTTGTLISRPYLVETRSLIKSVLLMVSAHVPAGATVTYEITTDDKRWVPIQPSADNVLNLTAWLGHTIRVRATLRREAAGVQPIIHGWAVLYNDPKVGVVQLDTGDFVVPPLPDGQPILSIRHEQLMNIGPDDHHPQEHSHNGADGSGLVAHSSLTGVGQDDHHPKAHRHGQDNIPAVVLESDIIGSLPIGHHSPVLATGWAGTTRILTDPITELVTRVESPESITVMEYDDEERLVKAVSTYIKPPANGTSVTTLLDYASEPPTITTEVRDAQGNIVQVDPLAQAVTGGAS